MSKRKTVVCVFGTRPEAIKMAPMVLALRSRPKEFRSLIVVTAQHRDMLDQVMGLFGLKADHDLNIMSAGQSLTDVTVRVLERLEPVFKKEKPDLVLVHGDTTTTMAATLAAFYQRIPVGHVEAGLRSHDKLNPYPEEMNRLVADDVCTLHFAPTSLSKKHLLEEKIPREHIYITGNTGIDGLHIGLKRMKMGKIPLPAASLRKSLKAPLVLITLHRRENFGRPILDFCRALDRVAREYPHVDFLYPVHPNPNVWKPVHENLGGRPNIHLHKPMSYGDLIYFLQKASFVVTDSGGLQEEAPSLGKPVLVLRKVTERPEAVKAGTVRVVGTDTGVVYRWMVKLLEDKKVYYRMAESVNPYGDGRAAERTLEAIRYYFGFRKNRPPEFKV